MTGPIDGDAVFGADPKHVQWFGDRIVGALGGSVPERVLDIGCGDGSLLVYLAAKLPQSHFLGIDLSAGSIAAARDSIATSTLGRRIDIQVGDYLQLAAARFDLIVASSSLQGINATSDELGSKIAADTAPGGYLIHVTPYRCMYNLLLNTSRRVLNLMRGRATDRLILAAARLAHPHEPDGKLRERVPYMYLVLRHHEDDLRNVLTRFGFQLMIAEPAAHTSFGQPKHRLAVLVAPCAG